MDEFTLIESKVVSALHRRGIVAVIFDVGGVFIRLRAEEARKEWASALGITDQKLQDILSSPHARWAGESLLSAFGVGSVSEEEFISMVLRDSGGGTSEMVRKYHLEELAGEDAEMTAFIQGLCKRFPVSCFSNTNKLHWDFLLQRYDVFKSFQHVMASHLCGMAKPAKETFLYMSETVGASIDKCLFIDDRRDNIEGSLLAGGQAIHFTSYRALIDDLTRDL